MKRYSGSPEDRREDKTNARKEHMSLRRYEKSPMDRKKDAAGQKRLDAKAKKRK